MPGGDGTGPAGMGPMTGRAAGICAGYAAPGYVNRIGGQGYRGWGRGGGRGRRNWYYGTGLPGWARAESGWPAWGGTTAPRTAGVAFAPGLTAGQELDALRNQAKYLGDTLGDINRRIGELESQKSSKEQVG